MNKPQANPVLTISGLSFAYPGSDLTGKAAISVISNLELVVGEGEIVSILGSSGCGKSTLLNLISGLLRPSSGTIDLKGNSRGSRRIGYIFQKDALFPWSTVEGNVMLASRVMPSIDPSEIRENVKYYLDRFHLDTGILKKYPAELSGGMRQRVSIIQSLMFKPEILLLDEPFSALDFYTKLRLEGEFYRLVKDNCKTAILVTHDIDEAIAMTDRVLIMSQSGNLCREFAIDFGSGNRLPEDVRGTREFADYYHAIRPNLREAIAV